MAVNNSLAKKQKMGLTAYLTQDAVKNQINSVVGGKNGTRFVSSIISAVQTTPALQECTNPSILSAALLGEALNLSERRWSIDFQVGGDGYPGSESMESNWTEAVIRTSQWEAFKYILGVFYERR